MNNKYNIKLLVPSLYKTYDLLIPVNNNIAEIIIMITKGLNIINSGEFNNSKKMYLYNSITGLPYEMEQIITDTDIKNGSKLILN